MASDDEVREKFGANSREMPKARFDDSGAPPSFGSLDEYTDLVKSLVENAEMEKMLRQVAFGLSTARRHCPTW